MSVSNLETATLAGGCFWCLEAVYQEVEGVLKVVSGYTGGTLPDPTYRQVCSGDTGHAEVVQVTFDADRVSYRDILEIFFSIHDPTTPNRQGADIGTQYRSAVFYDGESQKKTAEEVMEKVNASGEWKNPVVTQLVPLETFYAAEDYHDDYYRQNPNQGYCRLVISPKLDKFRRHWPEKLRK